MSSTSIILQWDNFRSQNLNATTWTSLNENTDITNKWLTKIICYMQYICQTKFSQPLEPVEKYFTYIMHTLGNQNGNKLLFLDTALSLFTTYSWVRTFNKTFCDCISYRLANRMQNQYWLSPTLCSVSRIVRSMKSININVQNYGMQNVSPNTSSSSKSFLLLWQLQQGRM